MRLYEWQLLGNYGYGWDVLTTEDSRLNILARYREYLVNDNQIKELKIKSVRIMHNDRGIG